MKAPDHIEQKYRFFSVPFLIAAFLLFAHFKITGSWRNDFIAPSLVFFSAFFAGNAYFMHQTKAYFARIFYFTKSANPKGFAFTFALSILISLALFLLATVPFLARE